jgi:single-strand DNA-binding protein
MSYSRTILLGNVGRDPEIRTLQSGDRIASFSIATSERWTDKATGEKKETTEWHNVVVFNQALVKIVEQYVRKGAKLFVEGQNKTRKWEKDGVTHRATEVVVGRFDGAISLEGGNKGEGSGARDEHGYGETTTRAPKQYDDPRMAMGDPLPGSSAPRGATEGLDDDIPF